jgi:hypothetical protein
MGRPNWWKAQFYLPTLVSGEKARINQERKK